MTDFPSDFEADRFLNLKQVAAVLGLSVWTVNYHRECGRLKVTRLSPNRIGVRKSELRRFIAARDADLTAWMDARAERQREKTECRNRWLAEIADRYGLVRVPQAGGAA